MNRIQGSSGWDRPQGISDGNWQYINDRSIATGYDESLAQSPLVILDQQIVQRHLPSGKCGIVVDFGCGTGRNLTPLLDANWQAIAIDLSQGMLQQLASKLGDQHNAALIKANLLELDCLRDDLADFGQCLFSTFGMLQGRANRQAFLKHAGRILKPGATLVIHAHNYWHHLRIRGGWSWMLTNFFESITGKCERGDRFADYRSVNQMMLHHFSLRSFQAELQTAGFRIETRYAILPSGSFTDQTSTGRFGKAVGWVLVCKIDGP
jgi:ubiquinone/menaquinone biosynthesis C-methylase UbiE